MVSLTVLTFVAILFINIESFPTSYHNLPHADLTSFKGSISCDSMIHGKNTNNYNFDAWRVNINTYDDKCKVDAEFISSDKNTSITGFFDADGNLMGKTSIIIHDNKIYYVQIKVNSWYKIQLNCSLKCSSSRRILKDSSDETERGEKGNIGSTGPTGVTGPTGPTGRTGLYGQKGDIGSKGDIGPEGTAGLYGQKGDIGSKGDIGPVGTGESGQKGECGCAATATSAKQDPLRFIQQEREGNVIDYDVTVNTPINIPMVLMYVVIVILSAVVVVQCWWYNNIRIKMNKISSKIDI